MTVYLRALYRNLVAGARLALFLPLRAFDFRATPLDYILLIAFNFAVWLVAAALRTGMEGEFDQGAPAIYLASVPIALVTALVIAYVYRAPERLLLIATALSAADSLFELLALALPWIAALTGYPRIALIAFLAWIWLAGVRAVLVCAGPRRPQLLIGALAVTAMIAIGFFAFPRTDVWLAPQDEEPAPLADERLF